MNSSNPEDFFKKYSNLYQFEEGSPEYLIDKEDFEMALLEYRKEILQAVADKTKDYILNSINN